MEFSTTSRIPVTCDADERARDLSRGAALALFRIVQEALTNVARHSGATRVWIVLDRNGDRIHLTIQDNGHGFQKNSNGGLGLVGMRARARSVGGELTTTSQDGVTIELWAPLQGVRN